MKLDSGRFSIAAGGRFASQYLPCFAPDAEAIIISNHVYRRYLLAHCFQRAVYAILLD